MFPLRHDTETAAIMTSVVRFNATHWLTDIDLSKLLTCLPSKALPSACSGDLVAIATATEVVKMLLRPEETLRRNRK